MASRDRRDLQGMYRRPAGSGTSSGSDPYGSSGAWLDPLSQFRRLTEQMDRWFDTMGVARAPQRAAATNDSWMANGANAWSPDLETFLRGDQFVVRMDLPGLNKEDLNVEVTDDAIVIHGERQQTHQEERDGYYRSERSYGRFYREVPLPDGAQAETTKANYRDGVLEISVTAPPRQLHRPRRIEIGASATSERAERARSTTSDQVRSGSSSDRVTVAHDSGRSANPASRTQE